VKRYKFRLAQVQRVRSIELDRAVGEVARARHALAGAEARVVAAGEAYANLPRQPAGTSPQDLRTHLEVLRAGADAVVASRLDVVRHQQLVQARMADWAEADRKVRLLDQLDERARARHTEEVLAEEQQELDDLVTARQPAKQAAA
jgi:flagellar FliJ protein